MGKIVVAIICIVLLLGFAGGITTGIHNWRTDEVTQLAAVTTGGGVTTGNVVLSRDLYNSAVSEVKSITSTYSEYPATGTYTEGTKTLQITGLAESQTRTLTIKYYSEKDDEILQTLGPFLAVLIFGGIIGAIVWYVWKGKRG